MYFLYYFSTIELKYNYYSNTMKKKIIPHCRNSLIIKYQNRRKRQNRYP